MTDAALASPYATGPVHNKVTPTFMAVFSEQLGLIGRAYWPAGAIFAAAFAAFTGLALWGIIQYRVTVDFPLDAIGLIGLFSMTMGIVIWGGEKLFQNGPLTTLPVARQDHILIRTLAGGVWLAGLVAWVMIWIAAMGLISGSDLGFDRYLLVGPEGPEGKVTWDAVRMTRWTPQTWHWLSPFTTAAIFYLLGCAMTIGVKRWWLWATIAGVVFLVLAADPTGTSEALVQALIGDPVGLDNMITGGVGRATTEITLPDGKAATAWRFIPSAPVWALAVGVWLAVSGALLWLAAWRHREG